MKKHLKTFYEEIIKFLKSTDFSKAFVLTLAIVSAIIAGIYFDAFEIGTALAMGALLSSPNDVTGSFRHKVKGILLAAFFAVLFSIAAGYAAFNFWILIIVLPVLMFGISYFAVFGFRASLIAFSSLFAIVLSFANISDVLEIWERAIYVGLGGLWYLTLTVALYFYNPKRPTERLLAQGFELTAKYLRIRGKLFTDISERGNLQKELILLQSELNETHEALREILISSRKSSGISNYNRRRLLIFTEMIDILELAMANPVNYERMDLLLKEDPRQILVFKDLNIAAAVHLEHVARVLDEREKLRENELQKNLNQIEQSLVNYQNKFDVKIYREGMLLQRNLFDYQEQLVQKINSIARTLQNIDAQNRLFIKGKEASKFITSQDYDPRILTENFNLKSPIFRHSLRLAIVVLAGFSIGSYFSIENAYWILLTIIVIMRPNYGLTKERLKQRMLGTIIGAIIAVGIVYITQNQTVYAVLAIISLILAFSMVQKNYKISAVFITLSIIFIYSLLQPDVLNVIRFRVIDTFIGAGLAALGNMFLWPAREVHEVKNVILLSIKANRKYLEEIDNFYHKKGDTPTSYKLARKQAFLQMGNLSAAFQRLTQEPKSRQKDLPGIYNIVGINQTFLSSLASLGTYIQNHPTTKASENFETFVRYIKHNLENAEKLIEHQTTIVWEGEEQLSQAQEAMRSSYNSLVILRDKEIEEGKHQIDEELRLKFQEAQLVIDQLKWLLDISEKLQKAILETPSI